MPTVKQADSLWIDYEVPNFRAIDSTWANWSGVFEISVDENSTPLVSGSLTRSSTEGIFNLRLNTSNTSWTSLAVGSYKILAQFSNTVAEYREERWDKVVVKPQGVA